MKARTLLLALPLLLLVLAAAACGGGGNSQSVPSGAVASVDGDDVSQASFDSLIAQAKKSYATQKRQFPKAGTPEYQALKTQAVAFLVQRIEFEQKAKDLGVEVKDSQVDARLVQIKKQYFGGDEKKYKAQLKTQGLTDAQVRADVKAQLVSEAIFKKVTTDVKVSDADVKSYYDKNKSRYGTPESRTVRHILVKTKAQADKLYDQLKAGADFAALAKKYSQDPGSKNQGGKLTITRGQTVAPFDQTAFLLKTNTISRPVKTQYGYHIIQPISAIKPATTKPLDKTLTAQIRSELLTTKRNTTMTTWVDDLKKAYDGKIGYAAGYAPPSTSTTGTTTG